MKKIISLILLALQVLTVTVFASAASLTDAQKEDLYKLGILSGDETGDLRLADCITRAEAAKMICAAGDIRLLSEPKERLFDDVSLEHWANPYICAAKEHGIVNGDGNGSFHPESNITNEEIVKMLVCLLGYGEMAEQQGGYPAGYTEVAARIGITAGLKLRTNAPAIRNDVAVMVSNALDTPVMVTTSGDENDGTVFIILDGTQRTPFVSVRGTRGMTWDTSLTNIDRLAQAFASQYPYKEGDTEKSFDLYPDVLYSSGMEKTAEGVEYECPAIYDDRFAYDPVHEIAVASAQLVTGDAGCEITYAAFQSEVLVPYDVFALLGCEVRFDKDRYVATVSKDGTTLELLPNLIGMRKNQAEGYWVPLAACARFIGDVFYVPLSAVAKEFGYTAEISPDGSVITVKEGTR